LDVGRQIDENGSVARACYTLGLVDEDAGRYAAAETHFVEALARFEATGDWHWANLSRVHIGIQAYGRGDLVIARARIEKGLAGHRASSHRWAASHALLYLGQIALMGGEIMAARVALDESLELLITLRAPRSIALDVVATVASYGVAIGQSEQATRLLAWAEAGLDMSGSASRLPERALYDRAETEARSILGKQAFAAAWEAGRTLSPAEAFAEANAVVAGDSATVVDGGTAIATDGLTARAGLTPRESEVLRLVARRLTDKEIAVELSLSPRTVMHHVSSLLAKLGVTTRREAAAWAEQHGID
jgi:DNA-binding CsgD family transcriptional regulator